MIKSVALRVVLIIACILILIGVTLLMWMMFTEEERNNIEVYLSDGKTEAIQFEGLSLVPGDSCEYNIVLKDDNAKKYNLTLDFVDMNEELTLKNFVRVAIIAGDETLCDELLATVIENEDIVLPVDFRENKNTNLKIVYYMPLDVGNDAKNAEASFELRLTASNE